MNRQEKEAEVKYLRDEFLSNSAVFLVRVKGIGVNNLRSLRGALRNEGANIRISKKRLMNIAFENSSGFKELQSLLFGQVALVSSNSEELEIFGVLDKLSKEDKNFEILAGYFDSRFLDAEGIKKMASVPPKPVLLAQICGFIKAPLYACVSLAPAVLGRVVSVVAQVSKAKPAQG